MIQDALSFFFGVHYPYARQIDRQRARILLFLTVLGLVGATLWIVLIVLPEIFSTGLAALELLSLVIILAPVVFYTIRYFTQHGRLNVATWILISLLIVAIILTAREGLGSSQAILYIVPVLIAGLLLPQRDLVLVTVIVILVALGGAFTQSQQTTSQRFIPANNVGVDLGVIISVVIAGLTLLAVYTTSSDQTARSQEANIERLRAITGFMSALPIASDEHTTLNQVVGLIHRNFPLAGARIYLQDMVGNLVMGSGGEVGQPTLTGEEVIRLTDTNIISEAARLHRSRTIMRRDRLDIRSHQLRPNSNVGVAVPILTATGDLLGVIDVQSIRTAPFNEEEIRVLETLASLVAALLIWLRSMQTLSQTSTDQTLRVERLQQRVTEYKERERRTSNVWGVYFQERGAPLIGFNLVDGQEPELIPASDMPETLRPAWEQGELHIEVIGDEQIINVPIKFRDMTLGAMSFAIPADKPVSKHHLEIAQTVSQRLALALENARLFEQSRGQAQREHAASEFTTLLTGATDVKTALNLAAHSFNDVLGAIHTRVYLQPEVLAAPAQYEDAVK
jgi:GAF domain-containing protein